jgi:hypothetical protein
LDEILHKAYRRFARDEHSRLAVARVLVKSKLGLFRNKGRSKEAPSA